MKRLVVAMALAILAFAGWSEYALDPLRDLCAIYTGSADRPRLTPERVMPCVVHTYADGHKDWLYDSFLLLELNDGHRRCFTTMEVRDGYTPADRMVWERELDALFTPGQGLDALNTAIERGKAEIGEPTFRHKVVLMVPTPIANYRDWGKVGRKKLDFSKRNDRLKAAQWYIDELVSRFKAGGYKNLDLEGIYWVDEMQRDDTNLPMYLAPYVHKKGLRFYWVPYFGAERAADWRQLGFDMAYLQPNYYFRAPKLPQRLEATNRDARANGMGVVFEADEKAVKDEETYLPRIEAYLDLFDREGVWDKSSVFYYLGSSYLYDASKGISPEHHQVLDRLAQHIASRHPKAAQPATADYETLRRSAREVRF